MSSIRRRLTLGLALACGVVWSAGAVVLYLILRAGMVGEFDSALEAAAETVVPMTEYSEGRIRFDSAGELMPAFERADRPDYFQVYRRNGSTLARSPSLARMDLPNRSGTLAAPEFWNLTLPTGRPGRAVGIRFVPKEDEDEPDPAPEGKVHEEVSLVVARDRAGLDRTLQRLASTMLLFGAATAAAAAGFAAVIVRAGLRPLSRLAERATSIDASSLQLRFPTEGMPEELAPIAGRLNDLLARLEASFARERRFSADVAHELRTPIAELRSLAEVSLKWPDDACAARRALEDALAISLQMETIATGLLSLARCEGGLLPLRPEPVRLAPLIDELSRPLAGQAGTKKLSITVGVPGGASWNADPAALRTILGNLLSNAVEYCPIGGAIDVRLDGNHDGGVLRISNTTSALAPEDVPHLFERFWRKDSARSSSLHSGLGLALAKAYADALGLRLGAALNRPNELTMELSAGDGAPPAP